MSKADELKAKNENLFERNTILLNENERLKKENAELKAQIEKMQCCENCAFFKDKTYDICHRIKKLSTRKCAFYKMI